MAYRTGDEFLFNCPRCRHHKPKFSVNFNKSVFKCWKCEFAGRLKYIISRYGTPAHLMVWESLTNDIDWSDFDNLKRLLEEGPEEDLQAEIRIALPDDFRLLYGYSHWDGKPALRYLVERGLSVETVLTWKIGFCRRGQYDRRIIIPSFDKEGRVNFFIARDYTGIEKRYPYLNPPKHKNLIFNEFWIDWDKPIVLVEGVFDAIKSGPNTIPLLGATLATTSRLFQKIVQCDIPVYLALDKDAKKNSFRLIRKFLDYGVNIYNVAVEPYDDVGSMPMGIFGKEYLINSVQIDDTNFISKRILL